MKALKHTLMIIITLTILVSTINFLTVQASTEITIPKPSIPEFTVQTVDISYNTPTTYSTDPYTGENITHPGYHIEATGIEIKIKNQPFTPYYDESRKWNIHFYYNIRLKGQYTQEWIELYRPSDGYPNQDSELEYTTMTYTSDRMGTKMLTFPAGAKVEFQLQALIGYLHRDASTYLAPWVLTGEPSGWSETQTLTLQTTFPSATTSPLPTQTPTTSIEPTPTPLPPIRFYNPYLILFGTTLLLIGLGILTYYKKYKK